MLLPLFFGVKTTLVDSVPEANLEMPVYPVTYWRVHWISAGGKKGPLGRMVW